MIGNVELEGWTMGYAKFGQGARTLVVIPGLSLRPLAPMAMMMEAQFKALLDDYTVYMFDRRDKAPSGYTIKAMAEDTYKAMKGLGINKAYLFGSSQGGFIIQELAIAHPEVVQAMTIASSSSHANELSTKVITEWKKLAEKGEVLPLLESVLDAVYSDVTLKDGNREAIIKVFSDLKPEELEQFVHLCEDMDGFDTRDRLTQIKCPVLVVGCEGDKVFGPEPSQELYDILSANGQCDIYIYEDTYGHAVYDEAPDFRDRMYNFFINVV